MKFTFLTLFPVLVTGYFEDSILKRALEEGKVTINCVDFRAFSQNRFHKVDDYQVGGGAGLVIEPSPIVDAVCHIKECDPHAKVIFLLPVAKPFTHKDACRLAAQESHLVLVCGRYEGIDERALEVCADEVFSMGDYILTGGEIPALAVCDAVSRQLGGVLGNSASLEGESFAEILLEPPVFARTKTSHMIAPPSEYSKGNHTKMFASKNRLSLAKTRYYRPDLYKKYKINKESRISL